LSEFKNGNERKIKVSSPSSNIKEEKFLSSLNKNMIIKKWSFGPQQVRSIRLEKTTKIEILVLKGEVYFASNAESKILKEGQQISLDFNPQWSFEEKATEYIKLGSSFGAEVLLIQTVVH
jgi:quercetin dioxygenase-like cupin family protein